MEALESGNIKFPISSNPMQGEFLCHCVSLGTRKSAIAGQPPPIWQHHNSIEACLGQLSIYVAKKQFSRWIQKWVDWPEMVWLLQKSVQTMQCNAPPTWSSGVEALIGAQARKARHKPNPPKPSKWQTRFKIRLCRTKRPWIFCQILFKIHQTENRNCVKPSSCSISRLHEPNVSEVSCTSNNRWRQVYK